MADFLKRAWCAFAGHRVRGFGTLIGTCQRCKHSVWTAEPRHVLYYGETHWFPPRRKGANRAS